MLRNILQLEATVQGKKATFELEHDTSIGVAKDLYFQIGVLVSQIEANIRAIQEAQEQEKKEKDSEEQVKIEELIND